MKSLEIRDLFKVAILKFGDEGNPHCTINLSTLKYNCYGCDKHVYMNN